MKNSGRKKYFKNFKISDSLTTCIILSSNSKKFSFKDFSNNSIDRGKKVNNTVLFTFFRSEIC